MDRKTVLSGNELFQYSGKPLSSSIQDFWAWSMSRLLADGPRGDLAEFIVNTALGMDTTIPKRGWGECDITYKGIRIEVKCSSVIQEWERDTPSKPTFSIAKTYPCDIEPIDTGYRFAGRNNSSLERRSDCYVFCLFANSNRETANLMDLGQWEFYIIPTALINERLGDQRRISMAGIERLGARAIRYENIKSSVDALFNIL